MGFDPVKDLKDLTGKVVIVTGSTSGIGFATAQLLFERGARVYLAARNEEKVKECIKILEGLREKAKVNNATTDPIIKAEVFFFPLELNDPLAAREASKKFSELENRLDVLVNNAAMILEDYKLGPLGVQEIFVVNLLSPIAFTHGLLPLLKRTAAEPGSDVRIVNVSSDAQQSISGPVHFKSKEDFNVSYEGKVFPALKRYGLSKLAFTLWTNELQSRLEKQEGQDAKDIIVMSLHPGTVFTENIAREAKRYPFPLSSILLVLTKLIMYGPRDGASTSAFAAASPKVREQLALYKAAYLQPIAKIGKCNKLARDPALARELWQTCAGILEELDIRIEV